MLRHPDKNPDDETATAKFQSINNAYRRLTNPDPEAVDSDDEGDDGTFNPEVSSSYAQARWSRAIHSPTSLAFPAYNF